VLAFVMIVRRVGEYALVRPGREMLFTNVDAETKYKAKNAIDTFVYRGGDVIAAWANVGIVAIGSSAVAAVAGMFVAGTWWAAGWLLGRRHDRTSREHGGVSAGVGPSGAERSVATGG
jgi:AAA family ATP:ADP antiporter